MLPPEEPARRVAQPDDPPLFTREPKPDVQSVHWRGRDLMPLLGRLGREVDLGAGGPRRTLRLHNPGLPYGTTNTFWASIQVILPGEVATAHRHSASAFRFVMHGDGAWTTVDGESAYELLNARMAPEPTPQAPEFPPLPQTYDLPPLPEPERDGPSAAERIMANPAVKSFLRSAASAAGREISRSIFGTGRRRRR